MSFRKREKEYEAAERKYRTSLIRIIRQAFLIRPPATKAGLRSINITNELKRPTTKKKLYSITEELYNLGTKHGTELIEELKPKTTSAAGRTTRPFLAAAEPYNQRLINGLTEHTVTNMAYIADDAKADLITSLEEGYAQGEGIPALTKRVQQNWDESRVRAVRFARTFTNEVYNQAHYNRYQDSGIVDGVQFSAHLDSRTSEQCRMLNRTIWAINDPAIQHPPLHFNCLVGGTKIKTFDGMENIEDILVGDMVLTHANRYRPVTDRMSRMADELIEIKTENKVLKITPNHPVLTLRDNIYKWVPAGELEEGDNIIIVK